MGEMENRLIGIVCLSAKRKPDKSHDSSTMSSAIRIAPRSALAGFSSLLFVACIVTPPKPPSDLAACPPVPTCPAGNQCSPIVVPPAPAAAPAPAVASTIAPRSYELKGSVIREVHSDITGKDYELIIGLPPSFEKEPGRRYPTLFLLDGQWDFTLLNALSGGLRYDQVMPEMLIVGLSYGGKILTMTLCARTTTCQLVRRTSKVSKKAVEHRAF